MKSISNRKRTLLRKLQQKKYRLREQLFIVEGDRAARQVLENGCLKVEELYFDEARRYWEEHPWSEMLQKVSSSIIDEETYTEISDTDNPQGVMALCRMPGETDIGKMGDQKGLIVATDAIQDPGNLGTIIRTAGWFGVSGLLSGKGTVDFFHPKVVRSTAGATGAVPFANVVLDEALPVLMQQGWQVILLDAGVDAVPLQKIPKEEKMVLVIGNEANGINPSLFTPARTQVRIASPSPCNQVESLNAAIALSITLYALT